MSVVASGGVRHFYRLEGHPDKPVLVLVHPVGFDHGIWDRVVPELTQDFRVLRYDLRGHGATVAPPGDISVEQLGHELLALAGSLGIRRFSVCGVSLGGLVGLWLGVHHPDRLERLIVANASAKLPLTIADWEQRRALARSKGLSALVAGMTERMFSPAYRQRQTAQMATLIEAFVAANADGYADALAALRDADLTTELASVSIPTLVVSSRDDLAVPAPHMQLIARSIPDTQAIELAGGHLSPVEAPEELAQAVRQFIEQDAFVR